MDDTTQIGSAKEPPVSPATPSATPKKAEGGFVSFGQQVHKWGTYISIDWFLNYATGIAFAMWGQYSKTGQQYWTKPMTAGATFVSEKIFRFKPGPALTESVNNVIMILSVIAGGMFTIPPLMVLESKSTRKSIVKAIDEAHYGKEQVANDPKFAESYAAMDNAPKQGFWTGLLSRLTSLAPLIASVYFEKPKQFTKPYFDIVEKNSERVYNAVGLSKERLFKALPQAEKDARWKFLHSNSAIDFGLEPWYAVLHMITFRAFAKIADGWKSKDPAPPQIPPLATQDIGISKMDLEISNAKSGEEKPDVKISHVAHDRMLAATPEHQLAT